MRRAIASPPSSVRATTTVMAPSGENNRDLNQLLDARTADEVINYHIFAAGWLIKRKGLRELLEASVDSPITMLEEYTPDIFIFGYGTTVARYQISTDTITNIKTDFSANTGFCGADYGDFFFVSNGVDLTWRMAGDFTIAQIAGSPSATTMKVIGNRLFLGSGQSVYYSEVDDGTDPPFNVWTTGNTLADASDKVTNRNAGNVNSIEAIGDNELGQTIVVLAEKGKWAFYINTADSAGALSKIDVFVMSRTDKGGARGAISTEHGIIYVNSQGLWFLQGVASSNNSFKDAEFNVGKPLGVNLFKKFNLDNATIAYDANKSEVYVSVAKDSQTNNHVIVYNVEQKAFSQITGWNINRFMDINGTIYGGSSVSGAIYECFSGFSDDGNPIGTRFKQELVTGGWDAREQVNKIRTQGFLSPSSAPKIKLGTYNTKGIFTDNKVVLEWTPQYSKGRLKGWNEAVWNETPFGGDQDYSGMVESFGGGKCRINNYQRIVMTITESSEAPHAINLINLYTRQKRLIRRNDIANIT